MTDINTTLETSGGDPKVTKSPPPSQPPELLFFTYANAKYHVFATLYPLFALISNPDAVVEIILSEYELFKKNYANIIEFYDKNYPGKVRYTSVDAHPLIAEKKIIPNSVRFVIEPTLKAKYVYIGDLDILLLKENILDCHLKLMEKYQSDFVNIRRTNLPQKLMGWATFISYDRMYPVIIPKGINLSSFNDEALLCRIMEEKNLRFPLGLKLGEFHINGVHISYFSRPPLASMTTFDKYGSFPAWDGDAKKYLEVRYTEPVIKFTECIGSRQIELRKIIQYTDMWAFFLKEHPGKTIYDRNAAPDKVALSQQKPPIETLPKQEEQPPKDLLQSKKHLDFLSNQDYHTACDRQDILSRFED